PDRAEHPADQGDPGDARGLQMEPLGDRDEVRIDAGSPQDDHVRWGLSLRDPRAVHRMRLEDLVSLLRERVHRLRGRLRGGLEGLRFEDLTPDFVRVRVGDFRREAPAPQDQYDTMLRAGADRGLDAT